MKTSLEFLPLQFDLAEMEIPMIADTVTANFPATPDNYVEGSFNLNKQLVKNHFATFMARVKGSAMTGYGISVGDVLMVDRAMKPGTNETVIAVINGEFTLKRVSMIDDELFLLPETLSGKPTKVKQDPGFELWGVVTYIIKKP
jgi:DNA polymerase V